MKSTRQTHREARALFELCRLNGSLDESRVRQVVRQVIASHRVGGLAVLSRFKRLVRLDRARHTAEVGSAVPLSADVRPLIETALARKYGRDIVTSYSHDPTLIAGVRVRIGSDVYDGSVKGGLEALEARFQPTAQRA
jgi:F-type H+-transporting ATPase subunit delta